jgi:hypothetical protein
MKSMKGGKAAPALPSAKPSTGKVGGLKSPFSGTRVMKGSR